MCTIRWRTKRPIHEPLYHQSVRCCGEVFKATAGYRRRNGNQVFLFAPGAEATNRYNPLDFVRPERGNRTTDIQNMASILVPENTVWQATAQQVMAGVISYVLESPFYKGRRNLGAVNSFFNAAPTPAPMAKGEVYKAPAALLKATPCRMGSRKRHTGVLR